MRENDDAAGFGGNFKDSKGGDRGGLRIDGWVE
jgi:hypothetical protein